MVKFNEVIAEFKKHKCELLMTEEVFNQKTSRITHEKYPYTASCGHQHEMDFNNFKNRLNGLCPDCSYIKLSKDNIEKYRLNPILSQNLEFDCIEYIITLIGDSFDVKFNGECCLADCCIKPKNVIEDKWLMVQMKSTSKPTSNGYCFSRCSNYTNCILMCICESDKRIWVFDGNKTTIKTISIGLIKSKYDEFEITKDTIHNKLTNYYNELPKYDFETIDTPITPQHKLERKYRKLREENITYINFIRNYRQGLVYDFMINNFKIQEKVSSKMKNRNGITFSLQKSNGKKKTISYQQGDNDFYWLNVNNNQHFYIIPEHELLTRNHNNFDKVIGIYLNPDSTKKCKNSWAKEYLFDYTKVDEEKLKKMFSI